MSGGITQLIAVGAQDTHLVGNPEVSFFRSTYRRHTNFSQTVERQIIQGTVADNGMSTVRFERKGDLLGFVYFTCKNNNVAQKVNWKDYISTVELLIGGQVIDEHTYDFSSRIANELMAGTFSKSPSGNLYKGDENTAMFYPLRFFFCENYQTALPLVALQYHDVELRIKWGASIGAGDVIECFSNYVYLDTQERKEMSSAPHSMLITQVQRAVSSNSKVQELNFNHPIKFLASSNTAVAGGSALCSTTNRVKLQINGTDVTDFKHAAPNFTAISSYYNTPFMNGNEVDMFIYPFCLDTSKLQPTGSLNFSRLDSARIVSETDAIGTDIYAVNYNILRIENGLGGLVYAN